MGIASVNAAEGKCDGVLASPARTKDLDLTRLFCGPRCDVCELPDEVKHGQPSSVA